MAEQTFRSPGFFDREIDQSGLQETGPVGTPAGVIGTADRGPAFVPITVGTFDKWSQIFGDLNPKKFGPYAVNEWMKHRSALTYLRVLGAGANLTVADISKTNKTGQAKNAGFLVTGTVADNNARHKGAVQFLVAQHTVSTNESFGMPMFSDNDSYTAGAPMSVNVVRGMLLLASGARAMVLDGNQAVPGAFGPTTPDDVATVSAGKFKLVLSSTNGSNFGVTDGVTGIKVFTASLNPSDNDYFAKILNSDPDKFSTEQHLIYADFAVDDEIASATTVAILSGSSTGSSVSGDPNMTFRDAFGHFDQRYSAPRSPWIISQPFGVSEYELFHFESLDDGEVANKKFKISISNIKGSTNDKDLFGTFTVLVRAWDDVDTNQRVLEQFPNCSLDPQKDNFVAKIIGDRKVYYNFDADNDAEKRLIVQGDYPNKSQLIRIVMAQSVKDKLVPVTSLPFGFKGLEVLKTNDSLTDTNSTSNPGRMGGIVGTSIALTGSILPPIPLRYKVTRGDTSTSGFPGNPGAAEIVNASYYWGVKFERNTDVLDPNVTSEPNELLGSYTKFLGIRKLDTRVTGTGADTFNNNKFTLARVAFGNTAVNQLTSSVTQHMKEAAYIRNGKVNPTNYTINDGVMGSRITLGTLINLTSSIDFNRFTNFAKFTTFMHGGFDGLNILDKDAHRMIDKAASFDLLGGAETSFVSPGLAYNCNGTGKDNNIVNSYNVAATIMTDPLTINTNVLVIPGIREPYVTDLTAKKVRDYGLAIYLMDMVSYDEDGNRLYDDSVKKPDVDKSVNRFESRALDNNYVATYFPDVFIDDQTNKRRVKTSPTIAALAALGFNDRIAYPWFAPAGFNRAALDFVTNVQVRLNVNDRDKAYDARINPIAPFPRQGFVVWGQKTLQQAHTALDRVNVRRLLLEVKRIVIGIANRLVFDQNTVETRKKFVNEATIKLGLIQSQAGVERFEVVMDETNNTAEDAELNKLNGRIVIVPTRTVEFIAVDFIITNSGVSFV